MPTIKEFKAILPGTETDSEVIQTKLAGRYARSLSTLETNNNGNWQNNLSVFEDLRRGGHLAECDSDGIYIYETFYQAESHLGVWCLASVNDLLTGKIKKHAQTLTKYEEPTKHDREFNGIEVAPVILTHVPQPGIKALIRLVTSVKRPRRLEVNGRWHCIWKVSDDYLIKQFKEAFASLPEAYIADGHHRCISFEARARDKFDQNAAGETDSRSWFSALFMASDELKTYEYHRLIRQTSRQLPEIILHNISKSFEISPSVNNLPVLPGRKHDIGLFIEDRWYALTAKPFILFSPNKINKIDTAIINQYILAEALDISDPGSSNILYIGGPNATENLLKKIKEEKYLIAFTLFPMTISEMIRLASAGIVIPPKSIWTEPKISSGVLMRKVG